MTNKEFNIIKKKIDALWDEKRKAQHCVIGYTLTENTRCEGHGVFVPTNGYHETPVIGQDTEAIKRIDAEIQKLETPEYLAIKNNKFITAKAKRYKKELEGLNKRKAYLEKWLEENT